MAVGPTLFRQQDPGSEFLLEFVEVDILGEPAPWEHDALAWVTIPDLARYDLAPSDRAFVNYLLANDA
jgi:8-oxo-dGTP pyrophosphatase MutT (NUDIX family)